MDPRRKQQLKKLGKAEVARRSMEIRAALQAANPAPVGSDDWASNYKRGTLREKWLRQSDFPLLHKGKAEQFFVITPSEGAGWRPHLGGYVQCTQCGSVSPTAIRKKWFYWAACECGNIRWRCIGPWRRVTVLNPEQIVPVKLIGKG